MPESSLPTFRSSARVDKTSSRSGSRNAKLSRTTRVLACSNCRIRKTKCDGGQPGCKTCEVYQVTCRYDKPPPMATIQAMSQRLREYEERIMQLEQQPSSDPEASTRSISDQHLQHDLASDASISPAETTAGHGRSRSAAPNQNTTLNEHGQPCYHGSTSLLHDPAQSTSPEQSDAHYDSPHSDRAARTLLATTAIESRTWEDFALDNAAMRTNVPKSVMSELLQLHWAWIAPMFMWVYRPAFMRDMSTGGQYCSEFLLTVLCAHSARFRQDKLDDALIARARLLLGVEVQTPSCISTVQALLQLSARDLAFGGTSQAWLYSGMAFRMVTDLGLDPSGGRDVDLDGSRAEDLEIRRRLFWSCYFWDKAISLYLGRMPILRELPANNGPSLLDDTSEHELWRPYYASSGTQGPISPTNYPPMKAHSISCFENSCKLAVIINEIIEQLYSRRASPSTETSMRNILEQLSAWRLATPAHLRYNANELPLICGPPHILTQNLLYHTTSILLHRPFSTAPRHRATCRAAADSIEALLRHYETTFGFTRMSYLMAYCVYLGASVMAQDVKDGDVEAAAQIDTFIRALNGSCKTCPGIQRSLDIIQTSLTRSSNQDTVVLPDERLFHSLPAFPHREYDMPEADKYLNDLFDINGLSMLDSFPEEHLDITGADWYIPI